ncbi:MAG: hypothetical protein NTX75_01845 [Proteobacteria bacterium]|nr:hypothetical protein [Pseudomonadota bacterium]
MAVKSDDVIEIKDRRDTPFYICDDALVERAGKHIGPFGGAIKFL